ncbi:MAG: glycosyltransferase [Gammaproteobacteria bacterium]|nr:glycosyltransferase [Gammaproteobacteria bacterium]
MSQKFVVHIITGMNTGGAEMMLYKLLAGMDRKRFSPVVISLSDGGEMRKRIEALGVLVYSLEMRKGLPTVSVLFRLKKIINNIQPDLIQGWMYHGNLAATLARSIFFKRAALAWNIRQSLYQIKTEKFLTRQVIRANRFFSASPDTLLYNSQLSRQQHENFGFVSFRGQIIPNGIDLQQFNFSEDMRRQIRAELAIPAEALVVGHVARLHPMKDHANFLQAAEAITLRYPNAHFLLSGRDVHLDNASFKIEIPSSLQSRFHLLGERSDVAALMSAMDVFCLSSAWGEGFPNVLGEAMAVGVPCVATDVGDSALVIGDCGVMVAPKDKVALAAGIESLLALPVAERRLLGEQARSRIKDKFTLGQIVEQYTALYKTIILEKRTSQ